MIAVFGGTFDPIHYGHLRPVTEVKDALALDKVYLVPASIPPHRPQPVATASQRLHMVQLAVQQIPGMLADDREIVRGGTSYTVDTLASFKQEYSNTSVVLVMGSDAFAGIRQWHQWQKIFELAHVIVMTRPGSNEYINEHWYRDRLTTDLAKLIAREAGLIYFHAVTPQVISASQIRKLLVSGKATKGLLPVTVSGFIDQHHIYALQDTSGNVA